jgi:hypothetical protein
MTLRRWLLVTQSSAKYPVSGVHRALSKHPCRSEEGAHEIYSREVRRRTSNGGRVTSNLD